MKATITLTPDETVELPRRIAVLSFSQDDCQRGILEYAYTDGSPLRRVRVEKLDAKIVSSPHGDLLPIGKDQNESSSMIFYLVRPRTGLGVDFELVTPEEIC